MVGRGDPGNTVRPTARIPASIGRARRAAPERLLAMEGSGLGKLRVSGGEAAVPLDGRLPPATNEGQPMENSWVWGLRRLSLRAPPVSLPLKRKTYRPLVMFDS
jgi:hypothetical protein